MNIDKSLLRKVGAGFLLFGAVSVDFISSLMSIAFDAMFIGLAIVVLWPLLTDNKES